MVIIMEGSMQDKPMVSLDFTSATNFMDMSLENITHIIREDIERYVMYKGAFLGAPDTPETRSQILSRVEILCNMLTNNGYKIISLSNLEGTKEQLKKEILELNKEHESLRHNVSELQKKLNKNKTTNIRQLLEELLDNIENTSINSIKSVLSAIIEEMK